jgi:type IV/VI secretion system ImpK/VasF family protein
MRSVSALWFHIETAFTEVQDLCVIARAAQLAVESRQATPLRPKRTLMSSAGLAGVPLAADPDAPRDPLLARATELARDSAFREQHPGGADIVEMRNIIRNRMTWLKGKFDEVFRGHESNQALFPIVVYVDELVKLSTSGASNRWEPLQSLIYNVDNGGELFFTILEERLEQQETNPLVLEIFYYCLAAGFTGAYQRDSKKLESFQSRLAGRFLPPPAGENDPVEAPHDVKIVTFPWEFYALAFAVVLAVYLVLSWLAAPG